MMLLVMLLVLMKKELLQGCSHVRWIGDDSYIIDNGLLVRHLFWHCLRNARIWLNRSRDHKMQKTDKSRKPFTPTLLGETSACRGNMHDVGKPSFLSNCPGVPETWGSSWSSSWRGFARKWQCFGKGSFQNHSQSEKPWGLRNSEWSKYEPHCPGTEKT